MAWVMGLEVEAVELEAVVVADCENAACKAAKSDCAA